MINACFGNIGSFTDILSGSRKVWLQWTAVHRKNLTLPKGGQLVIVRLVPLVIVICVQFLAVVIIVPWVPP